jgi:hypothetical protein
MGVISQAIYLLWVASLEVLGGCLQAVDSNLTVS